MAESKTWTERELRDLIQMEVNTGHSMQALSASILSGEFTAGIREIAASTHSGFTAQTTQVTQLAADVEATQVKIGRSSATARPLCNALRTRAARPSATWLTRFLPSRRSSRTL